MAQEHSTLALKLLVEKLAGSGRPRILDLGTAVGTNVAFFSKYSCQIHICDLYSSIRESQMAFVADFETLDRHLEAHFPDLDQDPFDLILAWDLLNYFKPRELILLGQSIARRCAPGSLIYALISASDRIPDLPTTFQIQSSEILLYQPMTRTERSCPQYKEPDLARALPELEVETSFLLRHGIQEYVLSYAPE